MDETTAPRMAPPPLLGTSPLMQALHQRIGRVAASRVPVLVRGESGTGKELVARAVHERSARAAAPFVAVNCTALPQSLLESELFGHVKGAFTGAAGMRRGLFVEADGGTLFLDEIGDMPAELQARLLRALQEGRIRPVGGDGERSVDVRVIAATHQPLERLVKQGRFREDLLYRLDVVPLVLPPLRERREDIPELAAAFLARARRDDPTAVVERFSRPLLEALAARPWPGNVRQLQNAVRRIVLLGEEPEAGLECLDLLGAQAPASVPVPSSTHDDPAELLLTLDEVEARHLKRVLAATKGNKTAAAKILGIERKTLTRKLARFGLGPISLELESALEE